MAALQYLEELYQTYPLLYARWLSEGPEFDQYDDSTYFKNHYWWLAPRTTLAVALKESGIVDNPQQNAWGYNELELADRIIECIDNVLSWKSSSQSAVWERQNKVINGLESGIANGYRMDQANFWTNETYLVYFPEQYVADRTAVPTREIILVNDVAYSANTDEFKVAPWMSLGGQNNYGHRLSLDGSTGKVNGWATERAYFQFQGANFAPETYILHTNDYYHRANPVYGGDDLNPYGYSDVYNNYLFPSNPTYDQRTSWATKSSAYWDITITDGKVTALTPAARLDGSGDSITGGWGYVNGLDNFLEVYFERNPAVAYDETVATPRLYYTTDGPADGSHSGLKATTDINDPYFLFSPGNNIPNNYYLRAIAIGRTYGGSPYNPFTPNYSPYVSQHGEASEKNWWERNWAPGIEPASVRITTEKPRLKSTTRSLKTTEVGTGAHRMSFEFQYAPMTQDQAKILISKFEEYVGKEMQLWVPRNAIRHIGSYTKEYDSSIGSSTIWPKRPTIVGGSKGDNLITLDGFREDTFLPGWYFTTSNRNKIYYALSVEPESVMNKRSIKIEPPLIEDSEGLYLMAWGGNETEANYLLTRAYITDDTLDYTVDAAGFYRITIKFREAL